MSENYYAKSDASSAGAVLAAAREEMNLSVMEVARHLKLSPAQVEALEEGAYDRLPGRVFVRGFLRNYAKLLGVDPEPLLHRIENEMPQPAVVEERRPPAHPEVMPTGESSRWTVYIGIAAVIIVGLAAYEFGFNAPPPSQSAGEAKSSAATGAAPAETAATQPAPATAAAPEAAANAPGTGAGAEGPASPPASGAAVAASASETAVGAAAASPSSVKAADGHELQFRFDEDSWVEVRDANDKVVLRKLNRAGSEERVSGTPPFKLVVGNARSVHLSYDGEAVDLGPHIGQTVARLTLK